MAHYFIKCVRCSQICWNENVLFDTEGVFEGQETSQEEIQSGYFGSPDPFETQVSASDLFFGGEQPVSNAGTAGAGTVGSEAPAEKMQKYMKCRQIQDYCSKNGLEKPELEYTEVKVSPDFLKRQGMERTGQKLLTGIRCQKRKGGPKMVLRKRICPNCKCELPSQAGTMPTYTVTLMGGSAAGKTVYLSAIQNVISMDVESLPCGSSLHCTSASRSYDDLNVISGRLFNEGMLPATTQRYDAEPLVLKLSYRVEDRSKECLLAINDMRGEDFTEASGENLIRRAQYFAHANAFMLLISPSNMRYFNTNLGLGDEGTENSLTVHNALITNIDEYILGNFQDRQIKCPSVVMLGKSDILKKNWERLRIPAGNAVVANEIEPKYLGMYFRTHNAHTRYLMTCDKTLCAFLDRAFRQENLFYTTVSSLGPYVEFKTENGEKRIVNPSMAESVRVLDPLLFILMKLGFLPEFYKMEPGKDNAKRNNEILKKWMAERTLPEGK